MKLSKSAIVIAFLVSWLLIPVVPTNVVGQKLLMQEELGEDFGNENFVQDPVKASAWFRLKQNSREGVINLKAEIAENWHVYSVTQPKGGPLRAKIMLPESEKYELTGDFEPDADPHVVEKDDVFGIRVEYHESRVVWSAPIKLASGVDPATLNLKLRFQGQTCVKNEKGETGACLPLSETVPVSFDGFDAAPVVAAKFKPENSHLLLSGNVRRVDGPGKLQPGDQLVLKITAEPTDDFHVYAYEATKSEDSDSNPTLFAITKRNNWEIGGPTTSDEIITTTEAGITLNYHEDPVTWRFSVTVPADAENKTYSLAGVMGFQTCTTGCDFPDAVKFSVGLPVGEELKSVPVKFVSEGDYNSVVEAANQTLEKPPSPPGEDSVVEKLDKAPVLEDTPEEIAEMAKLYDPDEKVRYLLLGDLDANPVGSGGTSSSKPTTFWTALIGAFLGGMILNLMPCVFPVLGLKVMGFVKQAGSDPRKIRMHGIAFAFGLVVSMWVLAGIILTIKVSFGQDINWGAQMGNPYFVVGIIVLLFLLGLNMAGVFEIGTSLTRVGGSLKSEKGYSSSFLSGVLTTLIATPCSGPFLGAAMSYTLAQPAITAMFLFTIFALGIATPYLLLSFFPALISRLPRPGAWMETFKVTMAFALFAVVAFFMQAFGGQTGVSGLSWLAMALVVIGLAAFFYGKWSPPHVKPSKKFWFGYLIPAVIVAGGFWMCYDAANQRPDGVVSHNIGGLQWQNWNPGKIEHSLANNKRIIWVDYTADW